jgi:hypothetical protein
MKSAALFLFSGMLVACTPGPDLQSVVQAPPSDGGFIDGGDIDGGFHRRPPRSDGGFRRPDGGFPPPPSEMGAAPCPPAFGVTSSFCYWPGGTDDLNLATALELSSGSSATNCTLMATNLSVVTAGATCTAEFTQDATMAWGFSAMKGVHLAFSYSIQGSASSSQLTVDLPSGSTNEVININGVSGQQNVLNLYVPAGTAYTPGFNLTIPSSAKKGSLFFEWISVSQ